VKVIQLSPAPQYHPPQGRQNGALAEAAVFLHNTFGAVRTLVLVCATAPLTTPKDTAPSNTPAITALYIQTTSKPQSQYELAK
jgi:hypothetical protein